MPVSITTASTVGLEGRIIQVEVDISAGLPAFNIVGLADTAVLESRERVRSAIKNSGFSFPAHRKTVNLAPSGLRKHGPAFDLPIAIGILAASKQITSLSNNTWLVGELTLTGELRPIPGIIPLMIFAKKCGIKRVILPRENAPDASIIQGAEVIGANSLKDVVECLSSEEKMSTYLIALKQADANPAPDFLKDPFEGIIGQYGAKHALAIAAAGHHNILLSGPPGVGKTLLAHAMASLLPPLSHEEFIEVAALHSLKNASAITENDWMTRHHRPVRELHHTTTVAAIIGGTSGLTVGEISLAHHGVLVLDELPEFSRDVLESLRQPLEEKKIMIHRASGNITYPANTILLATANPCPCGLLEGRCTCLPHRIKQYKSRISGPILDRIDLRIEMEQIETAEMVAKSSVKNNENDKRKAEEIRKIIGSIHRARALQYERLAPYRIHTNSDIPSKLISTLCPLDVETQKSFTKAMKNMHITPRGIHRLIKVARTIADMQPDATIDSPITFDHLFQALQFRID